MGSNEYQGTLLRTDNDVTEFYNSALNWAMHLSQKYYSVNASYTPRDVVHSLVEDILEKNNPNDGYNKGYNKGDSLKYGNYIRLLVERKYIDLYKYISGGKRDSGSTEFMENIALRCSSDKSSDEAMTVDDLWVSECKYLGDILDDISMDTFLANVGKYCTEPLVGDTSSKTMLEILEDKIIKDKTNGQIAKEVGVKMPQIGRYFKKYYHLLKHIYETSCKDTIPKKT